METTQLANTLTAEYMNAVMNIAKAGIRPDRWIIVWQEGEDQFAYSYRKREDVDFIIATATDWTVVEIINIA